MEVNALTIIRKVDPQDEEHILTLADAALGAGYVDHAALARSTCFVAVDVEEILGFVCVEPHAPRHNERVLKTIVVAPAHRGRGIAKQMALAALSGSPGNAWLSPAWISHGGEIPANRLLRSLRFIPEETIHDYWYTDSLSRGYQCPNCGNPCRCSAMMYRLIS